MYCPQCGGTNEDSLRYCRTCGLDFEEYRRQWRQDDAAAQGQQPGGRDPGQAYQPQYGPQSGQQYGRQDQQGYQPSPPPYPYQNQYNQNQYQRQPQQYGYGNIERIPNYMAWAIVTLVLCFWPTGIVAVVYASRVGDRLAMGDIAGAREASRKARTWSWISFGIALAFVVIAILISVLAAAATFSVY